MARIVQKYGGSSVATVEKLGQVADKIAAARRAGDDVVVVVSAMGKTTDELISLAKKVSAEPPRRELDMLVSTGERVSMALLSIAMQARGIDSISFTGSQSGIITSDRHFDARILEVRPYRIEDELDRGKVVIVAGYQGMSYKKEITTLGRGGSDTTAVALAAALGAERCEIYSDVDGVYSADPRVVPDAAHLPEVRLDMLQEMAEAGAKVLNAQAVEWARRSRIAIYARKTADPMREDGQPEKQTVCIETPGAKRTEPRSNGGVGGAAPDVEDANATGARVRAVTGLPRVVCAESKDGGALADALAELRVPAIDVSINESGARAVVALANVPDWPRCEKALRAGGVALSAERAFVSVVGDGLTTEGRALSSFLSTLAQAGAKASAVSGNPLRLSAVVESGAREAAERALHAAFCGG
jgi:aspartate kinase